ncbi:MAG: 50S ribosomal protein L32 [Dehalococcoidia bacterium]
MPVPKKKTPKSKIGKRRSQQHMSTPTLSECPQCHSPRQAHHACPDCGWYKGREAVIVKTPELPGE